MSEQNDMTKRRPELNAAQRALLEKWKRGEFSRDAQVQTIPRRMVATPVPMSFMQQRLWFLDQLVPESAAYNVYATLRLDGKLDIPILEKSLNEIVRRHEALRTTFASEAGQPVQIIAPTMRVPLTVEHLGEFPADERENAARRLATEEVHCPFDLARGPLLRMKLLQLAPEEHILIFTMHHIISDSWSLGVFLRELATLYTAFRAGKPSPLPDLSLQYADYAVWQRERLQGARLEQQLAYWKRQLDGCPTLLELPTDHPRPPVQAFRGAAQTFTLPRALTDDLKALARANGTTLFQVLLAAFQVLLSRYSGQHDIVVGSPIAGRTHADLEPLIGFFANTLALRTDLSGDPSFREVLARVQKVTLDAYAHQDMPFEQIVEALQPERVMSHNPLFQVMLVLQSAPLEKPDFPGLILSPFEVESHTAILDLWLSLQEKLDGDGLNGILEYNTDLFEAATISRLIGHYQTLLEAVVADMTCPISSLPLLTGTEERQILLHWNATEKAYALELCLHEQIEAQVKYHPDAIAVVFEDHYLSYQELNRRSNHLARQLQSLGVGVETLVGICMKRSLELVIGLLAILKAGAAYLPLDPTYPGERLAFMLQDAQAAIVLTQTMLVSQLQAYGVSLLCVESELQAAKLTNSSNPASGVSPANLVYVIYTSGSTGRPKGAMLTHRGVCNRLLWMQETYLLMPEDRVLQKTPFSFDVSVWEFFWPLLTGASLVIARPDGHRDSTYLVEIIREQQITTLHFVPSMLSLFLEEHELVDCTNLQRVICSGEALTLAVQERFLARLKTPLYNLYGPTEASIDVTAWTCEPQHAHHSVPIGRPIANTQIYLLDQQLRPVPIGVVGELYIGGAGLARGYLNRTELTAEKFIPNPFTSELGSRLYKTGDLARYLSDGNIEFLGRSDSQVKLHGFRIELAEIEAHLRRYPLLKDAVTMVREDTPGEKRLVAYVVPYEDAYLQDESLPDLLSAHNQVAHWQQVFEETYREPSTTEQGDFNIAGWNSSYTNLPLSPAEMQEWVEQTIERIASMHPQRILEIGCGTGLLLLRLAPQCTFYCGTDLVREGLDYIRQHLPPALQREDRVQLLQLAADDLGNIAAQSFDTIILNSVIQYFPDMAYLLQVLTAALQKLKPGGRLFIGDVRNLSLLEAFHTSVALHNVPASLSLAQLRQRIQRRIEQESELVVDPAFFSALQQQFPCITHTEIHLKRGYHHNELTRFRYDVILHVGSMEKEHPDCRIEPCWLDCRNRD
ncbi:MAG TPA: amino acid adenylation domain-containing protein [Ktedonosporobacter sp.]|jgi:amino acid adenylation domain-containing protein|nr:amino acid adenylation domain-containing protein [Ktedonosporobacter sp.]